MELMDSMANIANLLGTTPDNILAFTALVYAHALFVEIVIQVIVVLSILKGIEWLALRLKLLWIRHKSRRNR